MLGLRIALLYMKVMKDQFQIDPGMTFLQDNALCLLAIYIASIFFIIARRTWLLTRKKAKRLKPESDSKQLAATLLFHGSARGPW